MGLLGGLLGDAPKKKRKPRRYVAERVHLSKGGYDRRGRYWGSGERLYEVVDRETYKSKHVRAPSAKAAVASAVSSNAGWR